MGQRGNAKSLKGGVRKPVDDVKEVEDSEEERRNGNETEEESEEESEDVYEVERILAHRFDKVGRLFFQVKWKGYEDNADLTWEPEAHLKSAPEPLKEYYDFFGGKLERSPKPAPKRKRGRPPGSGSARKKTKTEDPPSQSSSTLVSRNKKGENGDSLFLEDNDDEREVQDAPVESVEERDDESEQLSPEEPETKEDEDEDEDEEEEDQDSDDNNIEEPDDGQIWAENTLPLRSDGPRKRAEKGEFPTGSWESFVRAVTAIERVKGQKKAQLLWHGGWYSTHMVELVYHKCPSKMCSYIDPKIKFPSNDNA